MPTLRQKRLLLVGASLLLILIGCLAGLYLYLPRYIESAVIPELGKKLGLETQQAVVRRIGFSGVDIGAVRLGIADRSSLSVDTLRIDYSLKALLHRKITAISLVGLRIRCDINEEDITIAGVTLPPATAPATGPSLASQLKPMLPIGIDRITVRKATVDIFNQDRHLAIPIELDMDTADLPNGKVRVAVKMAPRQAQVHLTADLDMSANRVRVGLDKALLHLEKFADLFGKQAEFTVKGVVNAGASATCRLNPFAIKTMAFRADLSSTSVWAGGATLENAMATSNGEAAPIIIRAEANSAHKVNWSMGPVALVSPARIRIDSLQGHFQKKGQAGELSGRCRASVPVQSLNGADGQKIELTKGVPLQLDISAIHQPETGTAFEIKSVDAVKTPTVAWQSMDVSGRHDLRQVFVSGKKTPMAVTVHYGVLLNDNDVTVASGTVRCPALDLSGQLTVTDQIQAETVIRIKQATVHAAAVSLAAVQTRLDLRLEQDKEKAWIVRGDAHVDDAGATDMQHGIAIRSLSASVPFQWPPAPETKQGRLTVDTIRWQGRPLGTLTGVLRQSGQSLAFDLRHTSKLFPGLFVLLKGEANKDGGTLMAKLPSYQTPNEVDLGRVSNAAAGFKLQARVEGQGCVTVTQGDLNGRATFKLEEGRLTHSDQNLEATGIFGNIEINDIAALASPPGQRVGLEVLQFGNIKASSLDATFQSLGNKSVLIQNSVLDWCEGKIRTEPFRLSADMKAVDAILVCEGLNLAMMLQQLGVAEGEGDGTVSGRIPVRWSDGHLRFDKGILSSPAGKSGIIRLRRMGGTEHLLEGLPPGTPQRAHLDIATEALKDYTYHSIHLLLENKKDILLIKLQLNGKPNQLLPFVYDKELGQFKRIEGQGLAEFKGIDIDLNLRSPLDEILNYKDLLKPKQQ